MEKKENVVNIIESVCEQMCNDFCRYSVKGVADQNDGTCGHYDDCPLNRLQ